MTETRKLTLYDLQRMVDEGNVKQQHPIIQQIIGSNSDLRRLQDSVRRRKERR